VEVSGRPVHAPRGLTTALGERARALAWPIIALSAALCASAVVVAAQPVRSPWWTYADADGTYVGAALDLLLGEPVRYLDHPGLPLEELLSVAFGVGELADRASGGAGGREYVDGLLLDLEQTKPLFRGLAIAFYLGGAALAVVLLARLFGHWGYGLAGGLLWIAAPGLVPMSIQYRPDVPLAGLALLFAYLIGRAVETRSALLFGAAAGTVGVAMMVKLHAAGLLVPLALAAVWRHPPAGWMSDLRRPRARWLAPVAGVWLAAALALNLRQLPFRPSAEQLIALLAPAAVLGTYALVSRRRPGRLFDPFYAFLGAVLLGGLWLPVSLALRDGMQALVAIGNGLTGRGISADVPLFSASLDAIPDRPFFLFALAGVAALLGLRQRDARPVIWFVGALALGVMAQARLAAPHYFAPAFMLSVPAAFWLLRRGPAKLSFVALAVVVGYLVLPVLEDRGSSAADAESFASSTAPALAAIEERLRPGEIGVVPSGWPTADSRFFQYVQRPNSYVPTYPFRFLPATAAAAQFAAAHGLELRYYTEPGAGSRATADVGELGTFSVRPVTGAPDVVELVGRR
jgi:hypothetical protein